MSDERVVFVVAEKPICGMECPLAGYGEPDESGDVFCYGEARGGGCPKNDCPLVPITDFVKRNTPPRKTLKMAPRINARH